MFKKTSLFPRDGFPKALLTENTMFFQGGNEYLYNVIVLGVCGCRLWAVLGHRCGGCYMGLLAGDVGVSQDDPSVRRRGQQWWDRDLGIKHIHPHNRREERKKFLLNRALASSEPCFIKFNFMH